ncbi:MAG: T9SS type A sorting domain-containing protein, partial [Saprospiraceae bacterium]|nr:T9SS type A sorting domain-containing protein [Saprospiraceae bacterium]
MTPVNEPGKTAQLTLSPNPASNWLNVTALFESNVAAGQSDVEIYATDGRLVQTNTVANGANFQLDVAGLPSGVYRLVLKTAAGRVEGTFAKS